MRIEELLEKLDEYYPDTLYKINTQAELDKRKAQRELISHIKLMFTPQKKKDK